MIKFLKIFFAIVFSPIILFFAFILFLSLVEWKPSRLENLQISENTRLQISTSREISILSWNIGYASLGDNADFFMDGGKSVISSSKTRINENLISIKNFISELDADILLLQEVDKFSSRSRKVNQYDFFMNNFSKYSASFANNYKCIFVPFPFPPLGKIDSGVLSLSKFGFSSCQRLQLPVPFTWPVRLANLKRCLLISRVPISNSEKELVLVNLHLEAYDEGDGKKAQTEELYALIKSEYDKGNYVIAAGDFNQTFSNVDLSSYKQEKGRWQAGKIDVNIFEDDFYCLMNSDIPSCRSLHAPYKDADKESFQYYIIDGFLISKNVTVLDCKTLDLGFKNSDHNPVVAKVKLEGTLKN